MPVNTEDREYHIGRFALSILSSPFGSCPIRKWVMDDIVSFNKNKLKTPKPLPPRVPTIYCQLPYEQRLEDFQLKLHRLLSSANWKASLMDLKRDFKVLIQEFALYEQQHVRDLDGAYLEGFSDAHKSITY